MTGASRISMTMTYRFKALAGFRPDRAPGRKNKKGERINGDGELEISRSKRRKISNTTNVR